MEFKELQEKVLEWADSHELLYEKNADKQFLKFVEEVFEFKSEFDIGREQFIVYTIDKRIKFKPDTRKEMKTEMGDIFVTLIILCKQLGIDPQRCLELAYDKIKDRKGKTIDGTFVKEEDL